MSNIIEGIMITLKMTPWWVYVLLIFLVYRGVKAFQPSVLSPFRLLIIPIVFGLLLIETIYVHLHIGMLTVLVSILGVVLGLLLGILMGINLVAKVDRDHRLIKIHGSYTPLIAILIIFVCKYYFGYTLAADPGALKNTYFEIIFILLSTIFSCSFWGKMIMVYVDYKRLPSTSLIKT